MGVDLDGITRDPFAVGALGSVVGLKFAPGATWAERCINVVAGALCAGYCSPALVEYLHVASKGMQSFMSFAVGLFGLSLAAAIVQGIQNTKFGDIFTGWLSRGGKKEG